MVLYKLISKRDYNDIIQNKRVSLSRPICEFGEPEGEFFGFFRDIFLLCKQSPDTLYIKPNEEILGKIENWCNDYIASLDDQISENEETYIIAEFRVMTNLFFQTYCGYYTQKDLFEQTVLNTYIKANQNYIRKANKTHVLRVTIPDNANSLWEYKPSIQGSDYTFFYNPDAREYQDNILANLHVHKVEYLENNMDYTSILSRFNGEDDRKLSTLFKYTKKHLNKQNETRLVLRIPSYSVNCDELAVDNSIEDHWYSSRSERLFYYAISTWKYFNDNYPRYVYLKINEFCIRPIVSAR